MCTINTLLRPPLIALSVLLLPAVCAGFQVGKAEDFEQPVQLDLGRTPARHRSTRPSIDLMAGAYSALNQAGDFIWVNYGEEQDWPTYRRVFGDTHTDGNKMYVCVAQFIDGQHAGTLYRNTCFVPWGGKERSFKENYKILLTNAPYAWTHIDNLAAAQIRKRGVRAGFVNDEDLYVCRKQMKDGAHPGKYLISTGLCYVPWGGKEYYFSNGFRVLTRE
jgi:hypothetical protein